METHFLGEKHKRKNYNTFSKELIRIINDKVRTGSEKFMDAHRRRGEEVLRYFFRLLNLYKCSKALLGNDWQNDPVHTSHIYAKIFDSLYDEEKRFLESKVDRRLEQSTLSVNHLKKQIVQLNKMMSDKIKSEIPTRPTKAILTIEQNSIYNNELNDSIKKNDWIDDGEPTNANEIEQQEETGEQIMDYTETSSDEE